MPALAQFNCSYFDFNYHPESVLPLSILQCWHQLLIDIRYCVCDDQRKKGKSKEEIAQASLTTDDLISIVIFLLVKSLDSFVGIRIRNLASSLPAHFIIIDAFSPCELACSVLGYTYGIMETAVTWILKNGKKRIQ